MLEDARRAEGSACRTVHTFRPALIMSRNSIAVLGICFVALLVALPLWWTPTVPALPVVPQSVAVTPASPQARISVEDIAQEVARLQPDSDFRLAETHDELARAAAVGDRRAACVLGRALDDCRRLHRMRARRAELERSAARSAPGSDDEAQLLVELVSLDERAAALAPMCQGIDREHTKHAWRYLARAAVLGDADARISFVLAPPLDPENMLGDLEGWTAYRDQVWSMLQQGIASVDVRALYLAYGLASGQDTLIGMGDERFHSDPVQALSYGLVLSRIAAPALAGRIEQQLSALERSLTGDARRVAHTRADALQRERFAGAGLDDPAAALVKRYAAQDCR